MSLSAEARLWAAALEDRVLAAADVDMGTVAETFLTGVLGEAAWEGFPESAKQMFTGNGPAIVAEFRGGFLDVSTEQLGALSQPTLLVAGRDSPPAFTEVTKLMAAAMPTAKVEWVDGGHFITPAHPVVLNFIDDLLADS